AVLRDITDRKEADEARRESEGLLKIFFDRGPLLAATKGPDGRYLSVIRKWCEFYGTTPEAVLGKLPTELPFLSTEKGEQTVAEDRASSEGRVVEIHDHVSTDKHREKRFLYTVKMPVREGEGTRVSVVAMSMDVTEQKRAEEALSKSRELLETIFETIPAAVFVKDPEGRFTMMNRVLAERFGTTPEKTVGLRPEQLGASPEMVRRSSETDREVIESKKMVQLPEQWVGLHKGKKIWSQVIKAPILDKAGRVSGIVGVGFDVTARKTIEEQLRQSQKMEALGTLAGGIAHDLNNILSPIIGYSELLLAKAPEESEDRTYAGAIVESAQRAKELVSQILLFGRRAGAEKRVIDLGPLVRELAKFTRSTLPKTMVVREEISTGPAPVFCDRSQIHQVLLNLCVNAGQAIPDFGEITIGLATVELDGFESFAGHTLSGAHVRIAVRDNGIGMDRETLGNIFDPFFTTKGVGGGTGLGLSTVFGIVQSHGGGIAVSSEPGAGTTFEVFLPLAEHAAENPADPGAHVAEGGSENILFVDDEKAIVKLAKVFLEQAGYHVTEAFDGRQALEIFSKNPGRFDLVVTDQTMPNMTGEKLASRLLALRRELPIILCTGNSENISPGDCQSLGIRKFLFKPISPAELGRAIRSVLNEANRVSPPG
ncbi:MAG: PAS domain S-box protein, partial [bacterium]